MSNSREVQRSRHQETAFRSQVIKHVDRAIDKARRNWENGNGFKATVIIPKRLVQQHRYDTIRDKELLKVIDDIVKNRYGNSYVFSIQVIYVIVYLDITLPHDSR